jgi:hypothetical protein
MNLDDTYRDTEGSGALRQQIPLRLQTSTRMYSNLRAYLTVWP